MSITLKIEGMSCEHCVKRITNTLSELEGITNIQVSLEKGEATFNSNNDVSNDYIIEALDDLGFNSEIK